MQRNCDNLCLACGYRWFDYPRQWAEHDACPQCGGLYWKWMNYETDFRKP